MVCFLAIILICVKGVWVIYVIHLYLGEFKYKGNYTRCRSPTKSGSWGLGMSSCKAQRRSRSCKNWFENRTAQGTTLQGEGAAGYISAALFYFAIGFRQYTGMFLHT